MGRDWTHDYPRSGRGVEMGGVEMDYSEIDIAEDTVLIREWNAWTRREGMSEPDSSHAYVWSMMWSAFLQGWMSGKNYSNETHKNTDH